MEIYVLIGLFMVFLIGVGFLKYRNGYPVNCWFCNYNSKVPFSDRNSFICKSCKQYNGFNRDGSYNRVIEAQHDESLNRRFLQFTSSSSQFQRPFLQRSPSNGLCDRCNHIQELRVQQLANFVPIRDFDREIEHFQNEIEKAFRLCDGCNLIAASLKYGDIFEGGRRTLPEERYHQEVEEPQQLNMKRRRSPRRPTYILFSRKIQGCPDEYRKSSTSLYCAY
ncbi:transmembrane protein 201 isoform X2 [Anthonomus grandis grandis]|uniref:transmembrane protein 201 isoform X2 n=1 Tax=Anthonomus grandis grandis TaxID=2921223 RepID=UPI002165700D|nr:transmembrane protein 201 isoform X2 [Anthonomus grandis grandis]